MSTTPETPPSFPRAEVVDDPPLLAPEPPITPETRAFWDATLDGRLLFRRCRACGEAIWYPRPICPFCHSDDTVWEQASGRGSIYSFSVVRRGAGRWASESPYVLAYVELDEGPRVMTNIVEAAIEDLAIGREVQVVFHRAGEAAALPRFRLVPS
jgi:uncharacterized protein